MIWLTEKQLNDLDKKGTTKDLINEILSYQKVQDDHISKAIEILNKGLQSMSEKLKDNNYSSTEQLIRLQEIVKETHRFLNEETKESRQRYDTVLHDLITELKTEKTQVKEGLEAINNTLKEKSTGWDFSISRDTKGFMKNIKAIKI